MHLTAENESQCKFLLEAIRTYFGVLCSSKEDIESQELALAQKEELLGELEGALQETAYMIHRIDQYHSAYPDTKDNFFYIKLDGKEAEHLLRSFDVYKKVLGDDFSKEDETHIENYSKAARIFIEEFCEVEFNQDYVSTLFLEYKIALKEYCEEAIDEVVEHGNPEVYVFCIHSFPSHHYQLVALNTVEAMSEFTDDDPFLEAANKGYNTELYNPACFHVDPEAPESYEEIEEKIKELFTQFYELTDEYSDSAYKEGSDEYKNVKELEEFAYTLFTQIAVEVLQEVDFSPLNRSKNFCAIVAGHGFSEEEFYQYARITIPEEKFSSIFPCAERANEEYLDFSTATDVEKVDYMLSYIKDHELGTVPEGRHYTSSKSAEYFNALAYDYDGLKQKPALNVIEDAIEMSPVNPKNPNQKHFLVMFSNECSLINTMLTFFAFEEEFLPETESRLLECFKKVLEGVDADSENMGLGPEIFASILYRIDKSKYPEPKIDMDSMRLMNISDYKEFVR